MNILREKQRALGIHPACADAPDTTLQQQAALNMSNLSREQLDWVKSVYEETAPDREAAATRAQQVSDAQLKSAGLQDQITQQYIDDRGQFRTLENSIVDEANAYDTPEKRAQKSGEAMSGVGSQFDVMRGNTLRTAAANGINTNSGAFIDTLAKTGVAEAAAKAAAGNAAATQVETLGAAKKADAANLGRNLSSAQATSAGLALTQGNSAVNTSNAGLAATTSGIPLMQSGFNSAIQGQAGAGALYGQAANAQEDNSGLFGAIGTIGGALIRSDEDLKEDIQEQSPEKTLAAMRKTPVSKWKYKKGANDKHVGPMAQAVQKTMGDETAPGGKVIDLISMNGKTMLAIQALDKQVQTLASQMKKRA